MAATAKPAPSDPALDQPFTPPPPPPGGLPPIGDVGKVPTIAASGDRYDLETPAGTSGPVGLGDSIAMTGGTNDPVFTSDFNDVPFEEANSDLTRIGDTFAWNALDPTKIVVLVECVIGLSSVASIADIGTAGTAYGQVGDSSIGGLDPTPSSLTDAGEMVLSINVHRVPAGTEITYNAGADGPGTAQGTATVTIYNLSGALA